MSPLRSCVTGAVRRELRVVADALGCEAVDQLGRLAALGERERAQALLDERRLQLCRLGESGPAQAELGIDEGRIPEHDGSLRVRRAVLAHHDDPVTEQGGAELARVCDRRRREQHLRARPVDVSDPAQSPEHVCDV